MNNRTNTLPPSRIADMMIGAIEGGATYWCSMVELLQPDKQSLAVSPWYADTRLYEDPNMLLRVVEDSDDTEHRIGQEHLKRGMELMAKHAPLHWADILAERDDAETADVFLQFFALGEIVYG